MRNDPVVTAPDGAFVIGGGFGQDIDEVSVRSLFSVPAVGSGSNTSLFESQLLKLPLDALKSFQPMIPDTTQSDFSSVGSAVSKIMGSLVDGPNVVIKLLQSAINQIIDIFNGLVVTPINTAVQGVADWFRDLVGWQDSTESNQQDLANSVWSGATSQPVSEDRTAREVRDAVAAMRARSDALRTENELRYRSSVPLSQGLIPGGDTTCSLETVTTDYSNKTLNVSGSSARTDSHDHGAGSYTVYVPNALSPRTASGGSSLMAAFRVRSDTPRNVVSFLAAGVGSLVEAYVSMWSYDYDADIWRCVSTSGNFVNNVGVTFDWVDVVLDQEYTPSMSELMAVRWTVVGAGDLWVAASAQPRLPAYHSVPYGSVSRFPSTEVPTVGSTVSLTDKAVWSSGQIPFAQIAPDLGQVGFEPPPQYWFDDFNSDSNSMYSKLAGATIADGHFGFTGTTDRTQTLVYKGQMSTPSYSVEATADTYTTRPAYIRHSCTNNGQSGVALEIKNDGVRLVTVSATAATDYTQRVAVSMTPVAGSRWTLSFDDETKIYTAKMNGAVVLTWADPNNLARRGKGKRTGGLSVSRSLFTNSGAWDDLLIYDHDLAA